MSLTTSKRQYARGTILNRAGQPVRPVIAPSGGVNMGSRLDRVNAWREYLNPLRGLTIASAVRLLEDYQTGRMADLQWTYRFIEGTDPDMIGLLENRLSRILEMDYNCSIEKNADQKLGEEQSDVIAEKIALIDNLYEGIEHLAMAPFRGFSHAEKWLNNDGDIFHLEIVDQWNVVRDGLRGPWKYNPTARSADFNSLTAEAIMPEERFLFREVRRPINRYALLKFIKQNLSDKDWDAFNEIYNVPGGVVIGPPEIPQGDEASYEEAARRVAEGGSGYLPYGSQYVPNKMPHDPQTFKLRLDHLSEKLVLAGTGGMLTMLAVSGSGTLAGGVHDEVFNRIARAEARRISEIINRQIVAPLLEKEFPGEKQVAYFQLAANEETDTGDAVDQVQKLSAAGYQVEPNQVAEKTGWVVTLKPQPVASPNPGQDSPTNPVTNRAGAALAQDGRTARYLATAEAMLNDATRTALKPIINRVASLLETTDDAAFEVGYRKLMADLPELEKQCLGDNASAELEAAFEKIIGGAMASGFAQAAEARAQKPVKTPIALSTDGSAAKTPTKQP